MTPKETVFLAASFSILLLSIFRSRPFVWPVWGVAQWILWGPSILHRGVGGQDYATQVFGVFWWYGISGGRFYGETYRPTGLLITLTISILITVACVWLARSIKR